MKTSVVSLFGITISLAFAAPALADSCRNSCVTMAVPAAEGVVTKLDGSADAVLWPPSRELRTVRVSALNDRGTRCDVTIRDVRQDEQPARSSNGTPIDDAANCHNEGDTSSVQLRSDRQAGGDGRAYTIRFDLADPDCEQSAKDDELLVMVPSDPDAMSLKPEIDEGSMTTSYSGPSLGCTPESDDRVSMR